MAFSDSGIFGDLPLGAILAIIIPVSVVVGLLGWGFMSLVYTLVGKMLGGEGTVSRVAKVVGSAPLPAIWLAPINIIILFLYGKDLFAAPQGIELTVLPIALYLIYNLLMMGLGIFSLVLQSMGLGLAHGFSSLRGFGVIAIVMAFFFIVILLLTLTIFSLFIF